MFIFAILVQKMDFEQSQFRRIGVVLTKLYLFSYPYCGYKEKIVLKVQNFCWINIFIFEMFIFAIFVQKRDFEESQFRRMGVRLTEF